MENTKISKETTKKQLDKTRHHDPLNANKFGSVTSKNGRLLFDFYYLNTRLRVATGYEDTLDKRIDARAELDIIGAEIQLGTFLFSKRFPKHRRAKEFARLENVMIEKARNEVFFGEYFNKLYPEIKGNYKPIRQRDFKTAITLYALPYLGAYSFDKFSRTLVEKYCAWLKGQNSTKGTPLSVKTMRNYFPWVRKVFVSAVDEYDWDKELKTMFDDPPLGAVPEYDFLPFEHEEWDRFFPHIAPFYRGYYSFFVTRGLRPEEIIALKWSEIKLGYINVCRTRVNGRESSEMKTKGSKRKIPITPKIQKIIDYQKRLAETHLYSGPYVFFNELKRPISPNVLMRNVWKPAIAASGIKYRRQYDCRHTFASWALAAGETIVWVSRILGHNTPMTTFNKYITLQRYLMIFENFTHTPSPM